MDAFQQLIEKAKQESQVLESRKKALEEAERRHREQLLSERLRLEEEMKARAATKEEELTRREEALRQREEALQQERSFVQDKQLRAQKKIKLDVGGVKYNTSLTTLTSQPNSMLAAMFSGRHPIEKDEDGCYFIDRSGSLFGHILEWLRTGVPHFPSSCDLSALQNEAFYYGLDRLSSALLEESTPSVKIVEKPGPKPGLYTVTSPLEFEKLMKADQLAGTDLRGITLRSKQITHPRVCVNLTGCSLAGMDLRKTRFINVELEDADFTGCDLRGAIFRDFNAEGCCFSGANLGSVEFSYAKNVENADFTGAVLTGAKFDKASMISGGAIGLKN